MPPVKPSSDKTASAPKAGATDNISDAERELYGGRLRYDQSYIRHEGPLTRLKFGHMATALTHMVGMVQRTGWKADRRTLTGVVAAELGQGVAGEGMFTAKAAKYRIAAPSADGIPGSRSAQPSGHETPS